MIAAVATLGIAFRNIRVHTVPFLNMLKFSELLNSSNTSCIQKLCCYIFTPSNYEQNSYIEVNVTIQ